MKNRWYESTQHVYIHSIQSSHGDVEKGSWLEWVVEVHKETFYVLQSHI